ncbi:UPF0146 family protein [Halorarius litoreus]|uniref:UPF0146 family protein n=1 Tax=Halorarius litoreus TaxID=2962676 RepID=UPI0020CCE7E1|nr:UPF0146 family protein [Halorarius litoreus]
MNTGREPLVDALAERARSRAVEVGIGARPDVAAALADRGIGVTATDVVARDVPAPVEFVHDDVTAPDPSVYQGADLVYALNCPPELQRPLTEVAEQAGAAWVFTTLGADPAVVQATRRTLPDETLFTSASPEGDTRR